MLRTLFHRLAPLVVVLAACPLFLQGEIQVSGTSMLLDKAILGDNQPQGVTYHPSTHSLFMVTKKPGMIFEVSLSGEVVRSFSIDTVTSTPEGISYDPLTGDLLVCKGSSSIYRISINATLMLPAPYVSVAEAVNAKGIAVHPITQNIFVADGGGHRIVEVDRAGAIVSSFDTSPSGVLQPQGLSFRGTELLIADDRGSTHSVYLFSTSGTKLQKVIDLRDYGFKDPDGVIDIGQDRICVALDDDTNLTCFQTPHDSFMVPFSSGLPSSFVGYTYLNTGDEADYLNIQGLLPEGGLKYFAQNGPFVPDGQDSRLTREAFPGGALNAPPVAGGLTLLERPSEPGSYPMLAGEEQPSMLKLQGQAGPSKGFFLTGDFQVNYQDGLGELPTPALDIYLPTAPVKPGVTAMLFLLNSSTSQSASVSIALSDPEGHSLTTVEQELRPYGSHQQTLTDLFALPAPLDDGYLRLTADQPIQAFLLVNNGLNSIAIAARPPNENRRFIVPHFYIGNRQDTTRLRVLNTDSEPASVSIDAFDDSGQQLAGKEFEVPPGELLEGDVAELLGLSRPPAGQTAPTLGFLEIDSHGPPFGPLFYPSKIVGNATFVGLFGQTETSLNFIDEGRPVSVFPYVAQASQLRVWQGLVIYNPDNSPTQVTVRAFNRDGVLSGDRTIVLPSRKRVVGLLHESMFFGPTFSQIGGHMVVTSTRPVVSTAIVVGDRFFTMIMGQAQTEN